MNINNFLHDFYQLGTEQDAQALTADNRPVQIIWNDTAIHTIVGPNPLIDISTNYENNSADLPNFAIVTFTLTGRIIHPDIGGIKPISEKIEALRELFNSCPVSKLKIICDSNILFEEIGVKVKDVSINKTQDNWTKSAEYTVSLEYRKSLSSDIYNWVQDKTETITIEAADDVIYSRYIFNSVMQKPETHNPNLRPVAPGGDIGSAIPPSSLGGGLFGNGAGLQILTIPQFRVTRRLSARGMSRAVGSITKPDETCNLSSKTVQQRALKLARDWVESQANQYLYGGPGAAFGVSGNTWLYNHSRTTSADVYNASYELNDTWLAMPYGISHIETFTIDSSTDTDGTRTIRINGNVQGLSNINSSSQSAIQSVSSFNNFGDQETHRLDLNLDHTVNPIPENEALNYSIPSAPIASSANTSISHHKYQNAINAYYKDIKPYLYRRACAVANNSDRVHQYTDTSTNPPNHIYSSENLLNVEPTSVSEGHDPGKGTLSYTHEFNNRLRVINGVLSENIRVSHTAPANNIQETQILGRALGPLLSNTGTTNPRKTISVDIVVPKPVGIKSMLQTDPSCPLYYQGYFWQTVDTLIKGHEPFANRTIDFWGRPLPNPTSQPYGTVFKDSDAEDWNPTEGRYSRTVSWVYQQCTTDRFYLDH